MSEMHKIIQIGTDFCKHQPLQGIWRPSAAAIRSSTRFDRSAGSTPVRLMKDVYENNL